MSGSFLSDQQIKIKALEILTGAGNSVAFSIYSVTELIKHAEELANFIKAVELEK